MWPVVPQGVYRVASTDIPNNNFIIPKNSTLQMNFWAIMRVDITQPDEFIPERWDANSPDIEVLKEYFCGFGVGKRHCIGQTLALLEMKLVLASLYWKYNITLLNTNDVYDEVSLILKPKNAKFRITFRS